MKSSNEHGVDVLDALCFGRPTKIREEKKKKVLDVVDKNPRLTLRKTTNGLMLNLIIHS